VNFPKSAMRDELNVGDSTNATARPLVSIFCDFTDRRHGQYGPNSEDAVEMGNGRTCVRRNEAWTSTTAGSCAASFRKP
jgi:hypothetical protein